MAARRSILVFLEFANGGRDGPPWQAGGMIVEAATDPDVFVAYLDQVLCPKLRPGHVVIMDNLSAPHRQT